MQKQKTSPHVPISSKDNSFVKHLRTLSESKYRKREKAFLIEGIKMVEEALRDDLGVKMVVASPPLVQHHGKGVLKLAESRGVDVLWITERLMDMLSENKTPQPVMAEVEMKHYSEEELFAHRSRLVIIVHQLQDPGNLGTIIRTAEAVSASGLVITPKTVDPFNAKAVRASMGSILRMPVVPIDDISSFIGKAREKGFQTLATTLHGDRTPFDVDLTKPSAVLFGREGAGLSPEIMADIDLRIRIPMAATIDSLNVATAAAVILYEAMKQRMEL